MTTIKKLIFISIVLCTASVLIARTFSSVYGDTITTIAGNGAVGFSGDGGSATSAKLDSPNGVAVDAFGNVYIADTYNNKIRQVDPSGMMSTLAGIGTAGYSYSEDGNNATSAQLNAPRSVAVDVSGNVYIADTSNNRIRKINTSDIISTIAGNGTAGYSGDGAIATSAQLNGPWGVAVDAFGNVYIADNQNNRIRKVNISGIISTIAGNGKKGYSGDGGSATSAQLHNPDGVAIDASGNVYISDFGNNRIRKVNTSGIISTIVGNAPRDEESATSAQLYYPNGVAVDASRNVYIADIGNNRIWKLDPSGTISTLAGTRTRGYSGDGGSPDSAQLYGPRGVAVDALGNVYIADSGNIRIRKITFFNRRTSLPAENKEERVQPGKKLARGVNIAVSEFIAKNTSAADASILTDFIRTELVSCGEFNILERANMETILAEQKFQVSGCTSQECAVKMGKILNVKVVLIGSLSKLMDTYYITVSLVDVETGKILQSLDQDAKTATELKQACKQIVERIK